jgi:hypothetical protein|tara:strand:+ start:1423 stop:1752 length:330 start_codon:yes stop_codon:yes gene_type:complete
MSQLFQQKYTDVHFYEFLNKYCNMENNKFIFNKASLKRAKLDDAVDPFLIELKKFYFPSKQFYLERDPVYKNIATIIRQICKYLHIAYTSRIKYSKSKYEIIYIIFPKQ